MEAKSPAKFFANGNVTKLTVDYKFNALASFAP